MFHLGGAYSAPTMIASEFNTSNLDFTGNGKLQGQIFTKTVGSPGKVRVLYRAMDPNRYADGEIVAEADTLSDGTFLIEGLNENFYYDVIAHNEGWNDRVLIKVKPVASELTLRAPRNVESVESVYGQSVLINWTRVGAPAEGLRVYRSNSPIDLENLPSPIAGLDSMATMYEDTTVTPDSTYYYAVSAFRGTEEKVTTIPAHTMLARDVNWDKVTSLVHFDGTEGSRTVQDVRSSNIWTVTGSNSKLTTVDPKFGTASFDTGNADSGVATVGYVSCANRNLFNFASENFTVECWVKIRKKAHFGVLFSNRFVSSDNSSVIIQEISGGGAWRMAVTTTAGWEAVVDSSVLYPIDQWQHIALVRNGNSLRLYQNGVVICDYPSLTNPIVNFSQDIFIGANGDGGMPLQGFIDEFRVTKGVARYTAPFTPPTKAFAENQGA